MAGFIEIEALFSELKKNPLNPRLSLTNALGTQPNHFQEQKRGSQNFTATAQVRKKGNTLDASHSPLLTQFIKNS